MTKVKTAYVCSECGAESIKWVGRCPSCGAWNSMKEITLTKSKTTDFHSSEQSLNDSIPLPLNQIRTDSEVRIDTGNEEFNRVLGGGLVPGSMTLIGGEPGIGKSTLIMQVALQMRNLKVLYVSGEESAKQLKLRADRLNEGTSDNANLYILADTVLERIMQQIKQLQPQIVIFDSIQTISLEAIDSSAGSISQIRECAASILRYAKTTNVPVLVIGHITKDGTIAGPKILEHIVDTVLQFEGDRQYLYRILRSVKNRFGSTDLLGIYEMRQNGLRCVSNPSELLLSSEHDGLSGIAIAAAIEGYRPFLIETQALVSTAAYGTPQRSATGFDQRRLNMLLAVLEKRVGFRLSQKDVFINIAGGLRVGDTALDLPIMTAVLSSNFDLPVESGFTMAGEVGLSGEIRSVPRIEQRITEAQKLGFKHFILPADNAKSFDNASGKSLFKDITLHSVSKVEEAFRILFHQQGD